MHSATHIINHLQLRKKKTTPHLQNSMALSVLSHQRDDLDDVQRGGPQEDKLLSKI